MDIILMILGVIIAGIIYIWDFITANWIGIFCFWALFGHFNALNRIEQRLGEILYKINNDGAEY